MAEQKPVTIHWFRHGLRLHDNPALLDGLADGGDFYPVFIFDGEVAGKIVTFLAHLSTKCSVSFCDPSMSSVRCPSSVRPCVRPSVNNFFKQHLL